MPRWQASIKFAFDVYVDLASQCLLRYWHRVIHGELTSLLKAFSQNLTQLGLQCPMIKWPTSLSIIHAAVRAGQDGRHILHDPSRALLIAMGCRV